MYLLYKLYCVWEQSLRSLVSVSTALVSVRLVLLLVLVAALWPLHYLELVYPLHRSAHGLHGGDLLLCSV